MPLEGLRWSRDSGSVLYDTPKAAVLGRAGGGNGKRSSLKKLHKYLREKTSTKESVQVGKPLMLRRQPIIMASVISLAIKTKHWKREACL